MQISAPPGPHQAMEQLEEEREQTMVGGSTGLTRAVLAQWDRLQPSHGPHQWCVNSELKGSFWKGEVAAGVSSAERHFFYQHPAGDG